MKKSAKKRINGNCKTCVHAIFDDIWGEFKCSLLKRVVNASEDAQHCVYYKKGEATIKASSEEE